MADQITLAPTKSSSLRSDRASTSAAWADNWLQAQNEQHLLSGYANASKSRFRSLLQFDISTATLPGVIQITKAELHVFTVDDHLGIHTDHIATATKQLRVAAKRTNWTSAGGGEGVWTGGLPDGGAEYNDSYRALAHISDVNLHENVIDVMPLVRYWAPKSVKDNTGKACVGAANYGMVLAPSGTTAYEVVLASDHHVNAAIKPFLILTVVLNLGPGVTLTNSLGDIPSGTSQFFTGEYEPGLVSDNIALITIKRMGGGLPDLVWTKTPDANEVTTSTFAVPVPASWPSQTAFTWAAKVKNSRGGETPYSATRAVQWIGTPPVLSSPQPNGQTFDSLISVPFRVTVNVPASQYRAVRWRVQLRPSTSPTDPTWADGILWDSGPVSVPLSASEATNPVVVPTTQSLSMLYGGPNLGSGAYSWRVLAYDRYGAASAWTYATLSLLVPADELAPPPGELVNLTGYGKQPPFRIRIYGMGANRGPGVLVAELLDATNCGASEFYNNPGEFFFTLPVTHPQAAVIEPYQCHYALELHTEKGWRPKAWGLITDFDANEDEVVFYGTDYLGLLARSIEERFDPTNAELPADKGGAKYVNQTISYVINDQLQKAKTMANSPVGFITVETIPAIAERVTIYASFKQRLPFISGLIESAKAGTGRRTRLVCENSFPQNTFRWRLLLDPGLIRENLELEYGGLVNGFRVIPFSNWGTAVAAVGRTMLGTKVYSALVTAPGISESVYGHWPSNVSYADLDDLSDLRRRATQQATKVSKVGKQLGLAIKVDSLGLKDGWDITDTIPVRIKRGVVDTTRMGGDAANDVPGKWTIWGWTWRSSADGHTDLTLSILPYEQGAPPNPDLIPSQPILSDGPEWAVGAGPPATAGFILLALDTGHFMDTGLVMDGFYDAAGNLYYDALSGIIYEQQPDGSWVPVSGPPTVISPTTVIPDSRLTFNNAGVAVANINVKVVQ